MDPILYRWDDGNAPVARGERRSLHDILYACLVTGYGDKPAAGWTREFVNATFDKAAFRNNPVAGTGFFNCVNCVSTATPNEANLNGYELMTDIDTGVGLFGAAGAVSNTLISAAAGTTARPWVLVADDRAFYLFIWYGITSTPTTSTYLVSTIFFGDFPARLASDAFACVCCVSNKNQNWSGFCGTTFASGAVVPGIGQNPFFACHYPRRESGVPGGFTGPYISAGAPCVVNNPGGAGHAIPYSVNEPFILTRGVFSNGIANSLRGWFPGLFFPCHALPFGQLETITIDGFTFLSIRLEIYGPPTAVSNILISLDDWRVA